MHRPALVLGALCVALLLVTLCAADDQIVFPNANVNLRRQPNRRPNYKGDPCPGCGKRTQGGKRQTQMLTTSTTQKPQEEDKVFFCFYSWWPDLQFLFYGEYCKNLYLNGALCCWLECSSEVAIDKGVTIFIMCNMFVDYRLSHLTCGKSRIARCEIVANFFQMIYNYALSI
jgi:hypothetical protein